MDDLEYSNEDLEKELDRTLELFKQLELEKKVEDTTEKLKERFLKEVTLLSKLFAMSIPSSDAEVIKDEVAFLSANTWDVSGGGNYGFNSIWVNRNNNIFDNLDYKPKEEVKNLKQLLDII